MFVKYQAALRKASLACKGGRGGRSEAESTNTQSLIDRSVCQRRHYA